jgi:hypothetical protein
VLPVPFTKVNAAACSCTPSTDPPRSLTGSSQSQRERWCKTFPLPSPPCAYIVNRAAVVSLVTSAINICVLTVLHGQEPGWICLASCAADVAVNSMV